MRPIRLVVWLTVLISSQFKLSHFIGRIHLFRTAWEARLTWPALESVPALRVAYHRLAYHKPHRRTCT